MILQCNKSLIQGQTWKPISSKVEKRKGGGEPTEFIGKGYRLTCALDYVTVYRFLHIKRKKTLPVHTG